MNIKPIFNTLLIITLAYALASCAAKTDKIPDDILDSTSENGSAGGNTGGTDNTNETGNTGSTGGSANTGETGSTGETGNTGNTGNTGSTGETGNTGGSTGETGGTGSSNGQLKAFPSAEGFGAKASGGRNGRVIKVTTLNRTGSGSFQDALDQQEARIIVFDVSGVIEGDITIPYGNVTIAGQTAPGAGITIHGRLTCSYSNSPSNIIIRHIRVRADHSVNSSVAGNQYDGIQCSRSSNLIFDHIDVSGGVDENFDLYNATDLTVQWSTITRSNPVGHDEPDHNYGLINGPNGARISLHHNLFAHNKNRNPAIANGPADIVNNVVYNTRHGFIHHNIATGTFNIIGNYYKDGPSSVLIPFFFDDENNGSGNPALGYFLNNNYIDDPGKLVGNVDNPWATPLTHPSFDNIDWGWDSSTARSSSIYVFDVIGITTSSATASYDSVLSSVGAFPRDIMTVDNVQEVRDRTGSWGTRIPNNLLQGLTATTPPLDTDNDGMPDAWESANNLSVSQPDSNTVMSSGYTAIEEYINSMADDLLR